MCNIEIYQGSNMLSNIRGEMELHTEQVSELFFSVRVAYIMRGMILVHKWSNRNDDLSY